MRNIFLEKLSTKCDEKNSPRLFFGKLKLSIFHISGYMQFVFIVFQVKGCRNTLKLSCTSLAYLILDIFKKQKEVWNQFPCLIFCIVFKGRYFPCCTLLLDGVSLSGCFYVLRYWEICVLQLFVSEVVTSRILKLIFSF